MLKTEVLSVDAIDAGGSCYSWGVLCCGSRERKGGGHRRTRRLTGQLKESLWLSHAIQRPASGRSCQY